jgi:integrase
LAGYESLLDNLILPRWRETKLKDITHADVQRWISGLSVDGSVRTEGKGFSPSRVIQAHQCMSAVLKYAIRTDRLAKNVANGIELPRKTASDHRYLTHKQLLELADATIDPWLEDHGHFRLLTLVMGYCGLRFGEAITLRGKDIRDGTITVRASVTKVDGRGYVEDTTKTHRTRWVPVPSFFREELGEQAWRRRWTRPVSGEPKLLEADPDQLVFPGRGGGYLTSFEYRKHFDPAAKDIGVPGLVPHELRHTCASLAIAAGANVLAVQRLLGHDTAAMTLDTYSHLFSDDLTKVAESLDKAAREMER